jgi:hypothetical protein
MRLTLIAGRGLVATRALLGSSGTVLAQDDGQEGEGCYGTSLY